MTPLTPTERAALDAAKASFDAERLELIRKFSHLERMSSRAINLPNYTEVSKGYHLAATILARQVAVRLTIG